MSIIVHYAKKTSKKKFSNRKTLTKNKLFQQAIFN